MVENLPDWAMKVVTLEDRDFFKIHQAYRRNRVQIVYPEHKALRVWAKAQGWSTPWFGFEAAFAAKMFESEQTFDLALKESGIEIHAPQEEYILSQKMIEELDDLYNSRSSSGRPASWGTLVAELREIRRGVEAGVKVKITGTDTVLTSWQSFYDWAHGRYHMLEDGYDSWIGDDKS